MVKRTDMKTLIVFTHPHEGSYCSAILKAVQKGLKKGGHPCKTINLDKDEFDPVMRTKDLKAFAELGRGMTEALDDLDPIVLRYKKKLEWAERIVMIFPIWWMTLPARRLRSRLRNLREVTVITTMNTPADVYSDIFGNSIEGSLIKGTFNQIGLHDAEWISLNMVKQAGDKARTEWLDGLEKKFEK